MRASRGLTLIEVLVVTVLAGLIVLGVGVSISSSLRTSFNLMLKFNSQQDALFVQRHISNHAHSSAVMDITGNSTGLILYDRNANVIGTYALSGQSVTYQGNPIAENITGLSFSAINPPGATTEVRVVQISVTAGTGANAAGLVTAAGARVEAVPIFRAAMNVATQEKYDTVQAAIDEADSGDEIRIRGSDSDFDGIFHESLVVNKSLTLVGDFDPTFNTQDSTGTPTVLDAGGGIGVQLRGGWFDKQLVLKNVVVQNGATAVQSSHQGDTVTATNSRFTGNQVVFDVAGALTLQGSVVENNRINHAGRYTIQAGGPLRILDGTRITRNQLSRFGRHHFGDRRNGRVTAIIAATHNTDIEIRDSVISTNSASEHLISASSLQSLRLENCRIESNWVSLNLFNIGQVGDVVLENCSIAKNLSGSRSYNQSSTLMLLRAVSGVFRMLNVAVVENTVSVSWGQKSRRQGDNNKFMFVEGVNDAAVSIKKCEFIGNIQSGGKSFSGILIKGSLGEFILEDCRVRNNNFMAGPAKNNANRGGPFRGFIRVEQVNGPVTVRHCEISDHFHLGQMTNCDSPLVTFVGATDYTVQNNIIARNGTGAGSVKRNQSMLWMSGSPASLIFTNNLFFRNLTSSSIRGWAFVVSCRFAQPTLYTIEQLTFVESSAGWQANRWRGGPRNPNPALISLSNVAVGSTLRNTIVARSSNPVFRISPELPVSYTLDFNSGSNPFGSNAVLGLGNLAALDPLFVDPANEDYHLQAGSPAINSGDPALLDTDGTPSDMGAYGGPGAAEGLGPRGTIGPSGLPVE